MRRMLSILAVGIVSAVSAAEPSAAGTHVVSASRLVVQADRIFQRTAGVTLTPCERTVGGETRKGVCLTHCDIIMYNFHELDIRSA